MPESFATLIQSVQQLHESNEGLATEVADLAATVATNDERYVKKEAAEIKETRAKRILAGLLAGGLVVALSVGFTMYLNHGTTCGLRGIIISAQSASNRNPLPDTLDPGTRAFVEKQRQDSVEFYSRSLDRLNIIWPCSGETTP